MLGNRVGELHSLSDCAPLDQREMMSDTVANMLTSIRNATCLRKQYVEIPASKQSMSIIAVLKRSGFIWDYDIVARDRFRVVRVALKYSPTGESALRSIVSISKPGNRLFLSAKDIPIILQGLGIAILSTNRGLLNDREAKSQQVGGEYVCKVY